MWWAPASTNKREKRAKTRFRIDALVTDYTNWAVFIGIHEFLNTQYLLRMSLQVQEFSRSHVDYQVFGFTLLYPSTKAKISLLFVFQC